MKVNLYLLVLLPLLCACGEDSGPMQAKAAPTVVKVIAIDSEEEAVLGVNKSGAYEVWVLTTDRWYKYPAEYDAIPVPPDSILLWTTRSVVAKDLTGWYLKELKQWQNLGKYPPAVSP